MLYFPIKYDFYEEIAILTNGIFQQKNAFL